SPSLLLSMPEQCFYQRTWISVMSMPWTEGCEKVGFTGRLRSIHSGRLLLSSCYEMGQGVPGAKSTGFDTFERAT
ncbi:MAG: hypothetical protein ABSH41_22145, partial [Syntrophobacteraceae bacterium]